MNKVYGLISKFVPIRSDRNRLIVSYNCQPEADGVNATWYEIYFYKKPHPIVTLEEIKTAILSDINAQTDKKILNGFKWDDKPVWLSMENQFNFKAAYDLAVQSNGESLPVTFKLGEQDGEPVYHTFESVSDLKEFYLSAVSFVQQCLAEGWRRKDSIDWDDYKLPE